MKTNKTAIIFTILMLSALVARADDTEVYSVNGKNFNSKAMAIRYVVNLGKPVTVLHTRCEILTNKLTFKACPKNKKNSFENEQFKSITATE